jgi:archaeal flagellar protein FlaJ
MSYVDLCYKFYGNISRSMKPYFIDIKDDIQHAKMNYTLEEYLSVAMFTVTITFMIETIFVSFILGLFMDPLLALVSALILSLAVSGMLFFVFYAYPVTVSKNRQNKINKVLPFAVSYLATMSSARVPASELFKALSKFKEYGELAEEAKGISNSIEIFGLTAYAAIRKQAKSTPSKELRDLLWSISGLITSGGDLNAYLKNKSQELMNDYRRKIRKYSNDLSLYVEIYLTLIVTGTIFFIVLSSIIAALSAGLDTVVLQSFIVFLLTPGISIAFIVLMKSLSPLE